jgi:hypothetical protein
LLECIDDDEKEYKMELLASTVAESSILYSFSSLPSQLMKATVLAESSILYYF